MKKYISIILAAVLVLFTAGCKKESAGVTRITYYPTITLSGDEYVFVNTGSTFTDPGFEAVMNGEDVSSQVVITTDLDTSTPGLYVISYSLVNSDGISAAAKRYVIVRDATDTVSGWYTCQTGTNRVYSGPVPYSGYSVLFYPYAGAANTYNCTDLLAGWYDQRAGYGSNYACVGRVRVTGGAVTLLAGQVPGWSSYPVSMAGGTYTAATNTMTYTLTFAGMDFYIILKKD